MCRKAKTLLFVLILQLIIPVTYAVDAQDKPAQTSVTSKEPALSAAKGIPISFDEAVQRMKVSNEAIIAARFEEEQRVREKSAAFGLFFPKVDVKANGVKMSDPVVMDLNDIRTAMLMVQQGSLIGAGVNPAVANAINQQTANNLPEFKKTLVEDKFMTVDATVTQPIFTGGKILAANRAADARVTETHQKLVDTQNRLITELVNRYFGYRLALKVVEVRKMVYDGMAKHLSDAKSLEKNGMIAHVECLHAEVAFSEADREYRKALRNSELALTVLNNTLGGNDPVVPASPLFILNEIKPLEYYRNTALENNPLLKQIGASRELAHQNYMKELSAYSPDIFVFGTRQLYEWHSPEYMPKWVVGFGATCTLFDGFADTNKVRAAQSQQERVASLESKAKKDICTLVEKNYQELMLAHEQFQSIQTSYKFAEEYLRVREKAFVEGSATSLDVVDAQLAFAKVRIDKLKAAYDFDVALGALLEASGQSGLISQYMSDHEEVEF